jgi:hypothetical protein
VVLYPAIRSTYAPRETPQGLWRQYDHYGQAKATSVAAHRALPSWRPVAPAALVAIALVGMIAGRTWPRRLAVPLLHALGCLVVGRSVSRDGKGDPVRAALVQEICHWSFGLGFWRGMWRMVRGRPVQIPMQGKDL